MHTSKGLLGPPIAIAIAAAQVTTHDRTGAAKQDVIDIAASPQAPISS